jgi:glycosyltransferase involved in cell wall biosynthesis
MKSPLVRSGLTPASVAQDITDFVAQRTEAVVARFLPDFVIPGIFCGHRRPGFSEAPDLIFLLGHLHRLGASSIAGVPIRDATVKLLRYVDGRTTTTFFSYRVAETLLAFGEFEGNPLLADFTDAERENIRVATDSTEIYQPDTDTLRRYLANNFWAVLARCEFARQQLGILDDDAILNKSVAHLQRWLFQNPLGFFDDGPKGNGRYDIYSADTHLFSETFWHLMDRKKLDANLLQHVRLLEKIGMENGAAFVYGRSIGALSICLMMELIATSIERGMATDPARSLRLLSNSLDAFRGWIEDDLINAHRHGNTESYRGIHRVLQMTFDCLGKLCYAAEKLRHAQFAPGPAKEGPLFPAIDEFIAYDTRNAGVWIFRNDHYAFQFPVVGGENSDYVPMIRNPGLLENPVGSQMLCGVPRLIKGALEYAVCGLPAKIEKSDGTLTLTHEGFPCVSDENAPPLAGRRVATYRVEGDTIFWDEHLVFDQMPDSLAYCIPEKERPLRVALRTAQPFHQDVLAVSGMADWRSAWGGLENLHQIQIAPAGEVRCSFEITPKIRVRDVPANDHDYKHALFGNMPADFIVEKKWDQDIGMNSVAMSTSVDVVHVSWPEHLFGNPAPADAERFDARNMKFIEELGGKDAHVVWTMHNRRPHHWDEARGRELYEAWARIADGVIHHSEWGMELIRAELPFREDARHVVIPHGHFGEQRIRSRSRAEIEASLGLPPCAMRFGAVGRWQKEKQIELAMEAFTKAARPDQQFVVTAYLPGAPKPADPRIIFLPRGAYMSREQFSDYVILCDALVTAHVGGRSYLTSGFIADAIGEGIPVIVSRWEFFLEMLGDAAFYHDNTVDSLAAVFASMTEADLERGKKLSRALQPKFAWPALAAKTLALYRSLPRKS